MWGRVLAIWIIGAAVAHADVDGWPEGSAMAVGIQAVQRRDTAAKQLATAHNRVVALMSEKAKGADALEPDWRTLAALKAQQTSWAGYMEKECELVGAMTGAGGSWPSTYAVQCEGNLTEQRLRRTRAAANCLAKLKPDDRVIEGSRCLNQLTPLAVPLRP